MFNNSHFSMDSADVIGGFSPQALPQSSRTEAFYPPRRPHICFVAPMAWPVLSRDANLKIIGGAEVQQCILARLLVKVGYRVSMVCLDFGQPDKVVVDGITVYRAFKPEAGLPLLRFVHPRLSSMWQAMRRANADVYYQRSAAMFTALVAIFCRRYGRRSIYAGASDSDFVPGQQAIRWWRDRRLFELGLAAVDAVVVQNKAQRENCLLHYRRNSTLIPSCYELPANARSGGGSSVLWVGVLRPEKSPERFLEMARRLPNYRFVLVGGPNDDPGSAACYDYLRRAAVDVKNLEITGFVPLAETESFFDDARVVVNTSDVEGMPNIFLQAWARGIPTVAFTDVGARFEGQPVYPVVDSLDAGAREIERLLVDQKAWARSGQRAHAYFVATHSDHVILERFREVLADLGIRDES